MPFCSDIAAGPAAGQHAITMNCGSSWEVDLRADVDCDKVGLERCHPRYTLGWRHREVQLHRDGLSLPADIEYVHAYCDVWRRGRVEQVLATPTEKARVRVAARAKLEDRGNLAGPNVILVVVRGLTLSQSRVRLPRTLRTIGRLRRSGRFRAAAFTHFAPASSSAQEAMQALMHGTLEMSTSERAAGRSLWRLYERWGYVTAFGEAGCTSAASRAAGYALDKPAPMHHALVEPACALDTQLRARSQWDAYVHSSHSAAELRVNTTLPRRRGRAEGCDFDVGSEEGAIPADEALLSYMEDFMAPTLYAGLPKLSVLALPSLHTRPAAASSNLDARLARFVRTTLAASPHTALVLVSDVPPPPPLDADGTGGEWHTPMLRVLFPTAGGKEGVDGGGPSAAAPAPKRRAPTRQVDGRELQEVDGWVAPIGCSCTGYSNKHGFGAHCLAWEKHLPGAEDQLPWCYVNDACEVPSAKRTRGSFGKVYADCIQASTIPSAIEMPANVDAPTLAAVGDALIGNAAIAASAVDVHATLMQIPLIPFASLLKNHTLPATCGADRSNSLDVPAAARDIPSPAGCSLLRPLPAGRSCEDTLSPPALCAAQRQARVSVSRPTDSTPGVGAEVRVASVASIAADALLAEAAEIPATATDSSTAGSTAGTLARLLCLLRRAHHRARASAAAVRLADDARSDCSETGAACQLQMPEPDKAWLSKVGSEADMFVCDAPTFATLERGVLTLSCPPARMPMYSIGLHPKLHVYHGPARMPNGTEYVAGYCFLADRTTKSSACERFGREKKRSNRAAIRRQCPHLSHGWVIDAAVENRRVKRVARRARRKQQQWEEARARKQLPSGANAGGGRGGGGLGLNVMLLMLDSISMARFKRGMPMTHALLESWAAPAKAPSSSASDGSTQQSRASPRRRPRRRNGGGGGGDSSMDASGADWRSFRFDLFTVVGSNSPRNQFPMLSGLTSLQWARDHGGRGHECIVPGFDDGVRADRDHKCNKWVFDDYRAAGYVSLFGTNMCDWGVMEEVYPFDTRHPPTDHHIMEPWCHVDYDVDKLYFRPTSRCLGGKPAHAALMKYESDFLRSYEPLPRFSWTVYLEGHEPSFRAMANLDADLVRHLLRMRAEHAQDTAIFIVSDHGIHYGKYYDNAHAGPTEHSLPLFYALFPRSMLQAHPAIERAMCTNRRRLVSPFDVHATLLALLSYPEPPSLPDWSGFPAQVRPLSMLEEVPATRTCAQAGVPDDACPRSAVHGCAI